MEKVRAVTDVAINYSEVLLLVSDVVPLREVNFHLGFKGSYYEVFSEDYRFTPVVFFSKHIRAIYESLSALNLDASKYVKKLRYHNGHEWTFQHFFFIVKGSTKLKSIHFDTRANRKLNLNQLVRDYTLNHLKTHVGDCYVV